MHSVVSQQTLTPSRLCTITELYVVSGEVRVGYQEKFPLRNSGNVLAQAALGVVESLSLEVFKDCGDVALRDVVMGMVMGWWLNFISVVYSDLYDSMIHLSVFTVQKKKIKIKVSRKHFQEMFAAICFIYVLSQLHCSLVHLQTQTSLKWGQGYKDAAISS